MFLFSILETRIQSLESETQDSTLLPSFSACSAVSSEKTSFSRCNVASDIRAVDASESQLPKAPQNYGRVVLAPQDYSRMHELTVAIHFLRNLCCHTKCLGCVRDDVALELPCS